MAVDGIRDSDVAIIGMACRFPGADSVDRFWANLCAGRDAITYFTDEELLAAGVDPPLLADPRYVKAGQVLPGVEEFDADFFAVAADEAEILDPQQRHFLECAYQALEDAGYDPHAYPGAIGVYAGAGMNTYLLRNLHARYRDGSAVTRYRLMLANDKDFLTTRVSYKLNLRGPSLGVNTACSTSLVAVHLACLGLLAGECEMALAGSVHIGVPPARGYLHQEGMIFSPDGVCRAFDAKAQGTVIGDGVGAVVLKRLGDALAEGDWIHAVIRGTAVNNDGAVKSGYTAPSVDGQAAVIMDAQQVAGCDPDTVSYVEAHGTGTPLGDPIEVAALTRAFAPATPPGPAAVRSGACALGSVKTNVGHLDAAAGMAGLIKTALMLEHRRIVPSLHFEAPNPEIDFSVGPFRVSTELADWPAGSTPRRAGVSSFGIGGTNAHVVVEEPPPREPAAAANAPALAGSGAPQRQPGAPELLVLSARTATALDRATENLARHLTRHRDLCLADVAYTLGVGRRAYAHRRALVCTDARDAAMALALGDSRVVTGPDPAVTGGAGPVDAGPVVHESLAPELTLAARDGLLRRVAGLWVGGADVDWVSFYAPSPGRRVPLPTYPFERRRYWVEAAGSPAPTVGATLRDRIAAVDGAARPGLVARFIADEISTVLGYADDRRPDAERNLFELGVDSLVLIEITARLSAELGRPVPASSFVEFPTITAFVENLTGLLGWAPPVRPGFNGRTSRRAALRGVRAGS
jgi:acyl transferase domain-containing protein